MTRARVITAKTSRLWRADRLGLVFSAALSVLPYLNEVFNGSAAEGGVARDTFDTLIMSAIRSSFDDQTEGLQRLLNCPPMRCFQMDRRHVCALNDDGQFLRDDAFNISIRQFYRPNQIWSQEQDRDCRYYGSAHTLITHWCRTVFASNANSDAVFELLTKANVDINANCNNDITPIEMIFDIALLEWKRHHTSRLGQDEWSSSSLLRKVQTLLDHECGPPLVEKVESALKRAERLRRYHILHYYVPSAIRYHSRSAVLKSDPFLYNARVWEMERHRNDAIIMGNAIKILKDAKMLNRAR